MDARKKSSYEDGSSPLSRRMLLKMAGLTGLGWAVGARGIFSGSEWKAEAASSEKEKPQSGGILTYGQAGDPPNFDIISSATYMALHALSPVYNNLIMYDPMAPNKIIGDLAEKWEVSPDGKIYTFSLKRGVKFHDGKPFTSVDCKFTLDRVRNPPSGTVSPRRASLAVVDGIETPDDHTLRVVLKRPAPSLLDILAQGWMMIFPKHVIEEKGDMKKDAIGTGPFKLKKYTRGVSIELVRNPEYHVKGRPYLDGVTFFIIPDPGTAMANLRTGQLLFHGLLTGDEARAVEKESGGRVAIQKSLVVGFDSLNINGKRKPWDDIRVRKAASLAINREEANKVVMSGDGQVSGVMMPGGIWALPPEELEKIPGYGKKIPANLAEAKKLLAEAGHPNGFTATLLTRKGTFFEPLSVFVKDQLAQIGIEAKLDVQETATAYEMLNKRAFDLAPWKHGHSIDDPDSVFGEFFTCDAVRNYSDVCDKEVDELYVKQSQTMDFAERKKLVNLMDKKVLLTLGKIPLYYSARFIAHSNRVQNYSIHPSVYNNQRLQDVWIKK
ncbi:MAG: ABC transporter substrate-binding protein [Candidatus Tectomicrobia bacterium]|uniref:ABC transporter substrate-binding protein n=1 Tax=Tectimicrobiota bacterium TaxID=2528274 RepID=A0A933LQE1_UNCTE|nr:ABC transporter substrate-binding protein [Candidatus Tectomicrobia bacterium]